MRGWPIVLSVLLLAASVPATAHHDTTGQVLLLDETDLMPVWHSVVVEWNGTKKISGHMTILDPHAQLVRGGDEAMWGRAVVFEYQQPNGTWRWFASLSGHGAELGSSGARVTLWAPMEADIEQGPIVRKEEQSNTFAWILTGIGGKYRVTTWADGEVEDGLYAFPMWGEPGVNLLGHTKGDSARWVRADDTATLSAGGSVLNHGVWARALTTVEHTFTGSAYISDNSASPGFRQCVCKYTGPAAGWDGSMKTTPPATFGGPPGTYTTDVIVSYNQRESIGVGGIDLLNPTRPAPGTYNDALSWVFADVTPPDI